MVDRLLTVVPPSGSPVSLFRRLPGLRADQLSHFRFVRLVVIRHSRSGIGFDLTSGSGVEIPGFFPGLVPDHHRLAGHLVQVLAAVVEDWEELGVVLENRLECLVMRNFRTVLNNGLAFWS